MRNTSFEVLTLSSRKDDNYVAQLWTALQPTCKYYVNLFAKTEAMKEEELGSIDQLVTNEQNVEQQIVLSDQINKLYIALEKLKPEEKEIIEQIYFENKSVAQLAQIYQASYTKMDSKKRQILEKIRKIFDEI